MPSLSEDLTNSFGTTDLYEVLNLTKTASEKEIKKGYYMLSLAVHPDRVIESEKTEATKKFQILAKVYSILSDKEKRAVYDETGEIDEEDDIFKTERDWNSYWRILFPNVTIKQIKEFEEKYKGSEEEIRDIKTAYEKYKGDMDGILETVLCASYDEEERYRNIIQDLIEKGDLCEYKSFSEEPEAKKKKRKKKAAAEAREAEKHKESGSENGDLMALIKSRQQSRAQEMDSFFDQLAAKYSKPQKHNKGGKGGSTKKKK